MHPFELESGLSVWVWKRCTLRIPDFGDAGLVKACSSLSCYQCSSAGVARRVPLPECGYLGANCRSLPANLDLRSAVGRSTQRPMDRPSFLLFGRIFLTKERLEVPSKRGLPRSALGSHKKLLQTSHSFCRMVGCPLEYLATPPQQIGQRLAGYVGDSYKAGDD